MTHEEAKILVNRTMRVILSCETIHQLNNAVTYAGLTYREISRNVGLINRINFVPLIERSIGYTQCKIERSPKEKQNDTV